MGRKKVNKPHIRVGNGIPPYQRTLGFVPNTAYVPKTYVPKPKRGDFIKPPVPPTPPPEPTLYYTRSAWERMHWLVEECATELGWVGSIEQVDQFNYICHDVRVMEQKAGPATFEYENWNDATTEMLISGTLCAGRVDANLGHSHVNMGVRPSGTDEDQMMDLADVDEETQLPKAKFSVQTIINKKGDHHCSIYDWENELYYDRVDVEVLSSLTAEDVADLTEQLTRVKKYTYSGGYGGSYLNNTYTPPRGRWNPYTQKFETNDPAPAVTTFDEKDDDVSVALDYLDCDYLAEMDDWTQVQWDRWEAGETVSEINADFLASNNRVGKVI